MTLNDSIMSHHETHCSHFGMSYKLGYTQRALLVPLGWRAVLSTAHFSPFPPEEHGMDASTPFHRRASPWHVRFWFPKLHSWAAAENPPKWGLCSHCWTWKDRVVWGHPARGFGQFADPGQWLLTWQGFRSCGHSMPRCCSLLNGATTCVLNPTYCEVVDWQKLNCM